MARRRVKSLDDLIVNVATINISDDAMNEDVDCVISAVDEDADDDIFAVDEGAYIVDEDSSVEDGTGPDRLDRSGEASEECERVTHEAEQRLGGDVVSELRDDVIKEEEEEEEEQQEEARSEVSQTLHQHVEKGARALPSPTRRGSCPRRIQQIRIRGKTVWEVRLTDPAHCGELDRALALGLFISSDAAHQHLVYKVDSLVSSGQLQLRSRDRLLEVNGVAVTGWPHPTLASFFLSIPLAPTRTPHARRTARDAAWQPFSMLVERTPRPSSKSEPRSAFLRLLRGHLSYHRSRRQVVFSEVTTRAACHIRLAFKCWRRVWISHASTSAWLAVTSLLAGRSRMCTRDDRGDATQFRLHEYCTDDPFSVVVYILQTPDGQFVSSSGNPAPAVSAGATSGRRLQFVTPGVSSVDRSARAALSRSRPLKLATLASTCAWRIARRTSALQRRGRRLSFTSQTCATTSSDHATLETAQSRHRPGLEAQFHTTDVCDDQL